MADLTFNPSQNSRLWREGGDPPTWAQVRDQATSAGVQSGAISDSTWAAEYRISRVGLSFDTSSIPDSATISAAVIKIYPTTVQDTDTVHLDVVSFAPTDPALHAVADYAKAKWGTTSWGSITHATLGANLNVLNSITLDVNGIANISKTGNTSFGLRNNRDTDDSAPGGANRLDITSTETILVVTYSVPAGFFVMF